MNERMTQNAADIARVTGLSLNDTATNILPMRKSSWESVIVF